MEASVRVISRIAKTMETTVMRLNASETGLDVTKQKQHGIKRLQADSLPFTPLSSEFARRRPGRYRNDSL